MFAFVTIVLLHISFHALFDTNFLFYNKVKFSIQLATEIVLRLS